MHSHISKWGNSLGIRLPRTFTERLGITEGSSIELLIEDDHITIKKSAPSYLLQDLLQQVNAENLHTEIDISAPVGKEKW